MTRRMNFLTGILCLALFVALALSRDWPPLTLQDEAAHYGYVLYEQKAEQPLWPDFNYFPLYGEQGTAKGVNYLNHPPYPYAVLAALHAKVAPKNSVEFLRNICLLIFAAGFALFLYTGAAVLREPLPFAAYALGLTFIPGMYYQAPLISNDAFAVLGGALACFGCYRFLERQERVYVPLALLGFLIAALTKLTAGLLCGILIILTFRNRYADGSSTLLAMLALVAGSLPYIYLWQHYGSPAPDTPAQLAMIKAAMSELRIDPKEQLDVLGYLKRNYHIVVGHFSHHAVASEYLNAIRTAMPGILLATLLLATMFAGRFLVYGGVSFFIVLGINLAFGYQRYLATGWPADLAPRYYFPLACIFIQALLRCSLTFGRALGSVTVAALAIAMALG